MVSQMFSSRLHADGASSNMDVAVEVEAERFKDHFTSVVTDEYGT